MLTAVCARGGLVVNAAEGKSRADLCDDDDGQNSDDEHYGGAHLRSRATGGGDTFEVGALIGRSVCVPVCLCREIKRTRAVVVYESIHDVL